MPTRPDALTSHLARASEINISVTGRKSGHTITVPVWFVFDAGKLYLLPVHGSDTQWYKNVLNNPTIRIEADGIHSDLNAVAVADPTQVNSVVEKFRTKYGVNDVKRYYSKFDVAAVVEMH